ncbi:MAG: hypothetical protein M3313_14150 [Actinomycetota bacterium]|nr:hypothetical protein [Actinomycetota bacterium]
MTETPSGFGGDSGSESSKTDVAKQQAAEVGGTAAQAGQHVAGVAKDEAANVAGQAKYEARNLLNQTRGELSSQASSQQQRAASGLRSLSSELQSMASKSESDGPATKVARQAADQVNSAASWLENREPGEIVTEIQRFARQRPGAFLAIAATAGVLVGRLTRGLTADSSSGSGSAGYSGTAAGTGDGWQQSGTAAYGTTLDPALAYEAPPATTGWSADPAMPVSGGYAAGQGDYPATEQIGYAQPAEGGYSQPAEGGYPQSDEGGYPSPGTGVGR